MSQSNREKNRLKRKAKQKQLRGKVLDQFRQGKGDFYFQEALWFTESQKYDKAETLLKKAIKCNPGNREMLIELVRLGTLAKRPDLIIAGILELRNRRLLDNNPKDNQLLLVLLSNLLNTNKFRQAKELAGEMAARSDKMEVHNRKQ